MSCLERDGLRGARLHPVPDVDRLGPRTRQFHLARDAMHAAAAAAVRGEGTSAAAVRTLERALAADRALRLRRKDGGLIVAPPGTAAEALARLVRDAVQDLSGPQRRHLRACGDDTCSGIFFDYTGRFLWDTRAAAGSPCG